MTDRPDDDGSFKRRSDYENRRDQEPSRSDGDSNWRRGAGTSMGASRGGYDDRRGGYDDRRGGYDDRRGGYDRRGGGGGYNRFDNDRDGGFDRRGGYNDNRGGFDNYDRRGGSRGGYDNNDRGGSGFDSFRRGGLDREPAGDSRASGGTRPRLQLKSRTTPLPEQPKPVEKKESPPAEQPPKVEAKKEEVVEPAPSKTEEKAPVETTTAESGEDGWATVEGVKGKPTKETEPVKSEEKETKEKGERKPSKKREPAVVNSRAAMLDAAPVVKRDVSGQFAVGELFSDFIREFNPDFFLFSEP